jgi:hypothetical protein
MALTRTPTTMASATRKPVARSLDFGADRSVEPRIGSARRGHPALHPRVVRMAAFWS